MQNNFEKFFEKEEKNKQEMEDNRGNSRYGDLIQ